LNSPDSKLQIAPPAQLPRRRVATILFVLLALLTFLLLARPALTYLRAAGLLLRMENPQHAGILASIHTYPVEESLTEIRTPSGTIRARLYIPKGIANPPGMLIVHGVHHLAIEEPRLVAFARALSASGIRVLTPELLSLADYQVDTHSIDLIGYSARSFSQSVGQRVGVLGISFEGGLSLLAASDPRFDRFIRFVLSVGAHDDLQRVSQFFISDQIARPDGTLLHMAAHEYGPLILIYSHPEDFFPRADANTAHEALRLLLWEKVDESRKRAELLSPASRKKMELLYHHHVDALAPEIEQSLARHRAEMSAVSPHGHLQALHVPVLLLHGAADNVIPPSELLWLKQDVPHSDFVSALTTPLISHASIAGNPTLADNLRLVHFMAQMLELADDRQSSPPRPMT
jgi:pimeloyl-ACP methyl ester carboxylesterase